MTRPLPFVPRQVSAPTPARAVRSRAALAVLAVAAFAACGTATRSAIRADEQQTWTAQITELERVPDSTEAKSVSVKVVDYATTTFRISLYQDLDKTLVADEFDSSLAEGDKVELIWDARMPPEARTMLENGQSLKFEVKQRRVTPPALIE